MSAGAEASAPSLGERVAALEAALFTPAISPDWTEEQIAEFRKEFAKAAGRHEMRLIPPKPPLTPGEIRQLLRECVTVVKPGETLVIQGRNWTPAQMRDVQDWMDRERESDRISFKMLAVLGDELAIAEAPEGVPGAA